MHLCRGTLQRTRTWKSPCDAGTTFEALAGKISSGKYGSVFNARCGKQDKYVVKWIINDHMDDNTIDDEISLQNSVANPDTYLSPGSARPIYEKWECVENGLVSKSGYVTDRLDVTLYSDWYTLSTEQVVAARTYYSTIFTSLHAISKRLFPTEPLDKVLQYEMMYEINHYHSLRPMEKLYQKVVDVFSDQFGLHIYVSDDLETITHDERRHTIGIPLLRLMDTVEQQKKKCFQFLMVMNCLDGVHNAEVYHNDAHSGNFMRKQDEDNKYYAIDFGRATHFDFDRLGEKEKWENPDIDSLVDSIRDRMKRNEGAPVQHDLDYLIDIYPLLKPLVSFEYDIDEDSYNDHVDQFTIIFTKEIKRRNKIVQEKQKQKITSELLALSANKDMANIDQLIRKTDATLPSSFGTKKKQTRSNKHKSKKQHYIKKLSVRKKC